MRERDDLGRAVNSPMRGWKSALEMKVKLEGRSARLGKGKSRSTKAREVHDLENGSQASPNKCIGSRKEKGRGRGRWGGQEKAVALGEAQKRGDNAG
jgi:hypothetical protein